MLKEILGQHHVKTTQTEELKGLNTHISSCRQTNDDDERHEHRGVAQFTDPSHGIHEPLGSGLEPQNEFHFPFCYGCEVHGKRKSVAHGNLCSKACPFLVTSFICRKGLFGHDASCWAIRHGLSKAYLHDTQEDIQG